MRHDLSWLLGAVPLDEFFRAYFERAPLHIADRRPDFYEELFTPADLSAVVYQSPDLVRRNVKTSRMFASEPGNGAPDSAPGDGAEISAWLGRVLESGDSVLIGDFARGWLPLGRLVREVEAILLNPVAASLFLSPANARGFPIHFDTYDTMVLQISGTKDWTVYPPTIPLPARTQNHRITAGMLGEPALRRTLQPGDLLYMPRGFIHETSTSDAASMHITLISLPYRWGDLLHDLVDEMVERDEALRRHVSLAACREIALGGPPDGALHAELVAMLRRCIDEAEVQAPVTRHLKQFIDELTPLGTGFSAPLAASEIDEGQRIARKRGMPCQIHDDGDRVVIRFPGGHLRGPAATRPALRFIASAAEPFCLGEIPGPLSRRSRSVLVDRLVREGLLELADRELGLA
jgi:hypothetical protein